MFQGNPYDSVILEAVHELHQGLRLRPAPLNLLRHIRLMLRQRRAVTRLQSTDGLAALHTQAADGGAES